MENNGRANLENLAKVKHEFLGKKFLVLTAHPDDESFAAAGTIYKNNKMGGQTVLVCATHGEKGVSHLRKPMTQNEVKKTRERELKKSAEILGISKVLLLNLPDAKLSRSGGVLKEKCLKIAKIERPEIIMSFGQDGLTGHKDHTAIGQVALYLAKNLKLDLYTFAFPKSFAKIAKKPLVERRRFGKYKRMPSWKFDIPDTTVKINPEIKRRALECHTSQLDPGGVNGNFSKKFRNFFLNLEYFKHVEYHRSQKS